MDEVQDPPAPPQGDLPEDKHKELAGVLNKMHDANEPEEHMKSVVQYYYKNYGTQKKNPSSTVSPQPSTNGGSIPSDALAYKRPGGSVAQQSDNSRIQTKPIESLSDIKGKQQNLDFLRAKTIEDIESPQWKDKIFKGKMPDLTTGPTNIESYQKADPSAVDDYINSQQTTDNNQKYWIRNQILNYAHERMMKGRAAQEAEQLKLDPENDSLTPEKLQQKAAYNVENRLQQNIANKLNNVGLDDKPLDQNAPFHDQITGLNKALMGAINYAGDVGKTVSNLLEMGGVNAPLAYSLKTTADNLKSRNEIPQNGEAGNYLAGGAMPTFLNMMALGRIAGAVGDPIYGALNIADKAGKLAGAAKMALGGVAISPLNSYVISRQYMDDQIKQGTDPAKAASKADQLFAKNFATDMFMTPVQMGLLKLPTSGLLPKMLGMGTEGLTSGSQFLMQGYNQESLDNPALSGLKYLKDNKNTFLEGAALGMLMKAAFNKHAGGSAEQYSYDKPGTGDFPSDRTVAGTVLQNMEMKNTPDRVNELHSMADALHKSGTYSPEEVSKMHQIIDDVAAVKPLVPKYGTPEQKMAVFNELLNMRHTDNYIDNSGHDAAAKPANEARKASEKRIGDIMSGKEPLYFWGGNETTKEKIEGMLEKHPELLSAKEANLKIIGDPDLQEAVKATLPTNITEIRHGETNQDKLKKASSQNESLLNPDGQAAAKELGENLKETGINKIVSSDVPRAAHTSDIIAEHASSDDKPVDVSHNPGLRSWDIGEYDNKPDEEWHEAKRYFVDHPDAKEYNGLKINESFNDWKDRVIKTKEDLKASADPGTLVVNHSNNIMLENAIEKHGGWNEEAKKEYLANDRPPQAELQEGSEDKLGKAQFANTLIAGRPAHFQDFFDKIAGEITSGPKDSSFDWRVDLPGIPQAEREGAVKDILENKPSPKATRLLAELERQYNAGNIEYTRGRGNNVEKAGVPAESFHDANKISKAEESLITEEPDKLDEMIKNEGITSQNIDHPDVKRLFDGFPFTPEDHEILKAHLNDKANSDEVQKGGVRSKEEPGSGKATKTGTSKSGSEDRSTTDNKTSSGPGDKISRKQVFQELEDLAKEPALAKLGEGKGGAEVKTPEVYADPMRAMKTIREEHPDDKLLNRAIDFLTPVLKDTKARIENVPGLKSAAGENVFGLRHQDGRIQVDFAAHPNMDQVHRTIIHELLHEATYRELSWNKDFKKEVRDILEYVREKNLGISGEAVDKAIPMLMNAGRIEDYKYGYTNPHELLSEVFTNQRFRDDLAKIPAPGSTPEAPKNILQKIYESIVNALQKHFGIGKPKEKIDAQDMGDYLMKLTENTVTGDKWYDRYDKGLDPKELAMAKGEDPKDLAIKNIIRRAGKDTDDEELKTHIKQLFKYDDAKVDQLMSEARKPKEDGDPVEIMKQAMAMGKDANKNRIDLPPDSKPTLMKTMKRWYLDKQDNVADVKSIIRKENGQTNQEIEQQFQATKKLTNYWNKVDTAHQLGFILGMENPAMLRNQPQDRIDMAKMYRERLDKSFDRISAVVPNLNYIEDFFSHFWEKPDEAKNFMAASLSKNPMEGSKYFTKQRIYQDIREGYQKGYKLSTSNPEELVRLTEIAAWKFENAHNIFNEMKGKGLVKFSTADNVDPSWVSIKDPMFNKMGAYIDGDQAKITGGSYVMPADVAKLMNDYLSIGIKGKAADVVRGYNNLKNAFQLGMGAYHFGTTSLEATVTGVTNGIQKISTMKPANIASGVIDIAKSATFVPNIAEQLYRGSKTASDYKKGNITDDVQSLIDANARVSRQKMYSLDATYNMTKAYHRLMNDSELSVWGKTKEAGKVLGNALSVIPEAINKPLMNWWVPSLKVGGFLKSLDAERAVRPDMSPAEFQKAKERIWDSMDNRLGQVVYDNMFMNKTAKDVAFLSLRSFGWTGGTVQAFGKGVGEVPLSGQRLMKGQGITQRTAYMVALPATIGFFGAMYQYAMTGEGPSELKDYFFPWDGTYDEDGNKHRVSLPSYMKDVFSYVAHPIRTIINKMSPIGNDLGEVISNKDFYGEQVYNPKDPIAQKGADILSHELQSMIPFSFKTPPGDEPNAMQKAQQKIGIMPAPKSEERSPLQNKIMQAYGEQVDNGKAATHEQMEQRNARKELRQYIHDGGNYNDADEDLKTKANISENAKTEFISDARLDPYIRYFKGLSKESRIEIYEGMSPEDQETYKPYLPKDYKP